MLTQDENIINVEFAVFWRIGDIQKFLFGIPDPAQTIKMAAESAMREVIGQNKLQYELTDGRGAIADDARARLQKLMDEYNAGVIVTQINLQTVSVPDEVKAAFQDVVNARLDQERFQNEAETHANKVVPEAKGEASKITQAGARLSRPEDSAGARRCRAFQAKCCPPTNRRAMSPRGGFISKPWKRC